MKLNSSLLNRSKKGYTSQASNSSSHHDVSRVRFSPQSAWSSSPASASRFGRLRSSARARVTPNTLTGTPVLVKKPSEGAMIGGSPFVVSRVYGEGPEVIGEKTPEAVHRRSIKLKALSVSQRAVRLPGLAQDLFGAGLSSESGNTTARNRNSFQASGLSDPSRLKGKGKQTDQDPPMSTKSTASGWVRDSELEKDLFGELSTQQLRRHSFAPLSGSNSGRLASSSTNSLNTTVKPKHAYRNSIGGPYALASSSGTQDERPPADMTSFLNELKSAGKDKLRKTVGSLKYYNPHNHFGSVKVSVLTPEQMPLPRTMDPKNTEIVNMMLEQDFGKSIQGSSKRSEANDLERSSSQLDRSTSLETSSGVSKDVVVEPLKSPLSRRIYPSSTSFVITSQTGEPGVSSSTHAGNRKSCDLGSTARTDPCSILGLEIEDEPSKQDRSSKQLSASARLRMVSESTPAVNEQRPRTPQRSASEAMLTRSTQASGSTTRSPSKHTRLLRSTQTSASNTSGPLSVIDTNRAKVARPVSILSTSFKPITDESSSLRSSSASSNGTRRVRIVEDATVLTRKASQRSTSRPGITDENLVAVLEEEDEEVVSGVGIGGAKSTGTVIGFGVGVGEAISTSGKEWVVVKSDSDRLGEGEANLRRWSLKPSAILRAHPKIVYPDENW
ncbi:hypothetical protein CROQUDRAFT_45738 [Cronartium quercuum f. sp. fusiforme G11]|uniref:Uncharacterized protein n=1 Tax=Cronartium quercuum f. sp. fusiforme G11 TaxID=708437 RepID=A0A9P6NKY0_9BASI|nr:hypothetical protein CROQUDRAFT_45738 [Cronartium quercuum f. sp. fusiforme G11]